MTRWRWKNVNLNVRRGQKTSNSHMTLIYHPTGESELEAAQRKEEYRAESLALEGFLHCSMDHTQVKEPTL